MESPLKRRRLEEPLYSAAPVQPVQFLLPPGTQSIILEAVVEHEEHIHLWTFGHRDFLRRHDFDPPLEPDTTHATDSDLIWLLSKYKRYGPEPGAWLEPLCMSGRLELLKWISKQTYWIQSGVNRDSISSAFESACARRHVDILMWMHESFDLTGSVDVSSAEQALSFALEKEHIDIASYLHRNLIVTDQDLRLNDNQELALACLDGKLEAVKFLVEQGKIQQRDITDAFFDVSPLQLAFVSGDVKLINYLYTFFPSLPQKVDMQACIEMLSSVTEGQFIQPIEEQSAFNNLRARFLTYRYRK